MIRQDRQERQDEYDPRIDDPEIEPKITSLLGRIVPDADQKLRVL